ncbi:MAG TPA: HAD hydrolase-like protein [Bacillales bacterium]|nr:HAD hydrolase-like protein [Bacillales bacterium]
MAETEMILFDVDGVILSEERYFDASALTVWELISSPNYLGLAPETYTPAPDEAVIRRIRKQVFDNDRVLHLVKTRGINANWDMVYLTFSVQLLSFLGTLAETDEQAVRTYLGGQVDRETLQQIGRQLAQLNIRPNYEKFVAAFEATEVKKQQLLTHLNVIAEQETGVPTNIFSRNSALWDVCQRAFQEWYLGNDKLEQPAVDPGKRGFLTDEIPIVAPEKLKFVFQSLKDKGITLGLGTGRPEVETIEPLKALGILSFFETNRIVTAKDVLVAERRFPEQAPLSKPQPFTFVYGSIGKDRDHHEVIHTPLPLKNADKLLIVGDSPADLYAARSAGARVAIVLTGLEGQNAREHFEQLGADYILNDVTEVAEIV